MKKRVSEKGGVGAATKRTMANVGGGDSTCGDRSSPACGRLRAIQALVVGLSIAVAGPAFSAAPDLKPGLWEYATAIKGAGVVMPDLSKLPPEQRERFRKALTEMETKPRNIVRKSCLTPEKIKDLDFSTRKKSPGCKESVKRHGSDKWTDTSHCVTEGQTEDAVVDVHVLNRTHVVSSGHVTVTRGAQVHKSEFHQDGKWVSADCGGLK